MFNLSNSGGDKIKFYPYKEKCPNCNLVVHISYIHDLMHRCTNCGSFLIDDGFKFIPSSWKKGYVNEDWFKSSD